MASTECDTRPHGADEMDYFSRLRFFFGIWALAMRVLSWRQAITTSRPGGTA